MKRNNEIIENKMDVSEIKNEVPFLCSDELSKIYNYDSAKDIKFPSYVLIDNSKIDLQIRGYVDYYGGYAEHTRNVLFRLYETELFNLKLEQIKTPIDIDIFKFQKCNWFIHNIIDYNKANYLVIAGPGWLQKKFLPERKCKVIGWTMIESMDYSLECGEWIKNADYILCPTETDIKRVMNTGYENAVKMRLGYDENVYNKNVQPLQFNGIGKDTIVFGVLGSWNVRKGVKEIIKAYCKAFSKKNDVCLLLVSKYGTRPYGRYKDVKGIWNIKTEFCQLIDEIGNKENLPKILLVDNPIHENILPHVLARFDCLVGFSKGESTWLPGLQAMNMGKLVIQLKSDCNGFMEYMDDINSLLCNKVKYYKADEELYLGTSEYYEDCYFAYGDEDELKDKMVLAKEMIEKKDIVYNTIIERAKQVVKHWTWNKSIKSLKDFLIGIS
jgi:glycosyltransferase involved in cell wall biosynthesis